MFTTPSTSGSARMRDTLPYVLAPIRALPVLEIEALSLTKLHTSGGRRNMWTIKARWYLLKHFVLHGSFLLKSYTYIPKLMYFQILLKDFVRNVHLEDVSVNTDGPLLFTCFGGRRKCGVWWAIMPWFQEPARWEWDFKTSKYRGVPPKLQGRIWDCNLTNDI